MGYAAASGPSARSSSRSRSSRDTLAARPAASAQRSSRRARSALGIAPRSTRLRVLGATPTSAATCSSVAPTRARKDRRSMRRIVREGKE